MNFMTFHILGIIVPTDELIFFRWVGIPPTSQFFGVPKICVPMAKNLDEFMLASSWPFEMIISKLKKRKPR